MRKINYKKQASKLLNKAKRKARKPNGNEETLKKNASSMSKKMTWPEKEFLKLAKEIGVVAEKQKIVGNKIFDFFIPSVNTLVEIHGDYWHANPELYEGKELNRIQERNLRNDQFKTTLASGRGYQIEIVWEYDLKNNYNELKKRLHRLWKES